MKVIQEGHVFDLNSLDGNFTQHLTFVERTGPKYPGNLKAHPGTTTQEVLRALINRQQYVNRQLPHYANLLAIQNYRETIFLLEQRAASLHGRSLNISCEELQHIENLPYCEKCGHIALTPHPECVIR